jgi:hypothetical protein
VCTWRLGRLRCTLLYARRPAAGASLILSNSVAAISVPRVFSESFWQLCATDSPCTSDPSSTRKKTQDQHARIEIKALAV